MNSAIEEQLVKIKREAEEREVERKSKRIGVPYLDLAKTHIQIEALKLVDKEEAEEAKVVPVEIKARDVILAVFDAEAAKTKEIINNLKEKGYNISLHQVSLSGLQQSWKLYEQTPKEKTKH